MKKAILATKVGMTQIFNEDGVLTPVTVLQAGPCVVTQVKTVENRRQRRVQCNSGRLRREERKPCEQTNERPVRKSRCFLQEISERVQI